MEELLTANKYDKSVFFKILFAMVWTKESITLYLYGFLLRLMSPDIASAAISIICVIAILGAMKLFKTKITFRDILFVFTVAGLYLLSYTLYPENSEELNLASYGFLLISLPCFCVGKSLNYEAIEKFIFKLSCLTIVAIVFYKYIYGGLKLVEVDAEDMSTAYAILPSFLVVLFNSINNRKYFSICMSIVAFFVLFSCGTRGPLLCAVFFILSYFAVILFKQGQKKKLFVIMFFIVVVAVFSQHLLESLNSLMDNLGLSTRILSKMNEGEFLHSDGREFVQGVVLAKISSNPLFGYGFCADRVFTETYSHNIILELCLSVGIPLAFFLILSFAIIMIKALKVSSFNNCVFLLLLFSSSFFMLMISGSFLDAPLLFVCIGYAKKLSSDKRIETEKILKTMI